MSAMYGVVNGPNEESLKAAVAQAFSGRESAKVEFTLVQHLRDGWMSWTMKSTAFVARCTPRAEDTREKLLLVKFSDWPLAEMVYDPYSRAGWVVLSTQ